MRQVSQSLIKKVIGPHGETAKICPYRLLKTDITHEFENFKSSAMKKGIYGETLILGKNRDGVDAEPEVNKKTGNKLIDYERIDEQVNTHLGIILARHQINIVKGVNVQVPVWKKFKQDDVIALVCGHLDLFPTSMMWPNLDGEDESIMALVDIKFTADVFNTFGPFAWGEPHKVDHFQADFYQWLVEDFDYELNVKMEPEFEKEVGYDNIFTKSVMKIIEQEKLKFIYIVLGYTKTDNQILVLERMRYEETTSHITGEIYKSNIRRLEAMERTRKALVQLDEWDEQGYPIIASYEQCTGCPVSKLNGGTCRAFTYLNRI